MAATKSGRIALRLTSAQKAEIERAAAINGTTISDFSVSVLTREAADVIRRDHELTMSQDAWDAFNAAVAKPARSVEGFARLLKSESVFVD